jgi:hypothetical protein
MAICCFLAFVANCKAWVDGEVWRSRTGSFTFRRMRRDDNPVKFNSFMIGMFVLNGFFFVAIVLWGIVLWK